MTVRCTHCNKINSFRNKRGNKLADQTCSDCNGKLETVGGIYYIAGCHPFDGSKTQQSKWYEGQYFAAEANRKGQIFILHDGYYHYIENPVFATAIKQQNNQHDHPNQHHPGIGPAF